MNGCRSKTFSFFLVFFFIHAKSEILEAFMSMTSVWFCRFNLFALHIQQMLKTEMIMAKKTGEFRGIYINFIYVKFILLICHMF